MSAAHRDLYRVGVPSLPPISITQSDTCFDPAETEYRIAAIVAANEDYARYCELYRDTREQHEALTMRTPLTAKQAYGYLGFFLGAFPPAAYFYLLSPHYGLQE